MTNWMDRKTLITWRRSSGESSTNAAASQNSVRLCILPYLLISLTTSKATLWEVLNNYAWTRSLQQLVPRKWTKMCQLKELLLRLWEDTETSTSRNRSRQVRASATPNHQMVCLLMPETRHQGCLSSNSSWLSTHQTPQAMPQVETDCSLKSLYIQFYMK